MAPASGPKPGTKFTTPFGNPASLNSFAVYNNDKGVCSAGFNTMVQPVASTHLPRRHNKREIPRNNLSYNANRFMACII